jgi:DNA-binding transcriptional ArsR family regulator
MRDEKSDEKLIKVLGSSEREMSITEIVLVSRISRSAVRTMLARLEGAGKVSFRKVGMTKLYSIDDEHGKNRNW